VSSPAAQSNVVVRRATPADATICGQIAYDAFATINARHGFPPDFPSVERSREVLGFMFSHPGIYGVVAELDGRIVGSNCMDERGTVAGVGPITVDPNAQDHGVGRILMDAVLARSRERGFPSVRLLQAAFHTRSLSLYTKLGFHPRELIATMQGPRISGFDGGAAVRVATVADIDDAARICEAIHGHNRMGEFRDAVTNGSATVVERLGRITGYSSAMGFVGHSVAESNLDMRCLIAAAASFGEPGILVPVRNADLFRWCLNNGLRIVHTMTLMTIGLYNEPAGPYLPSVLY
jgi:ribosomal protein S18 acetylase RimI-like enzyme